MIHLSDFVHEEIALMEKGFSNFQIENSYGEIGSLDQQSWNHKFDIGECDFQPNGYQVQNLEMIWSCKGDMHNFFHVLDLRL